MYLLRNPGSETLSQQVFLVAPDRPDLGSPEDVWTILDTPGQ